MQNFPQLSCVKGVGKSLTSVLSRQPKIGENLSHVKLAISRCLSFPIWAWNCARAFKYWLLLAQQPPAPFFVPPQIVLRSSDVSLVSGRILLFGGGGRRSDLTRKAGAFRHQWGEQKIIPAEPEKMVSNKLSSISITFSPYCLIVSASYQFKNCFFFFQTNNAAHSDLCCSAVRLQFSADVEFLLRSRWIQD